MIRLFFPLPSASRVRRTTFSENLRYNARCVLNLLLRYSTEKKNLASRFSGSENTSVFLPHWCYLWPCGRRANAHYLGLIYSCLSESGIEWRESRDRSLFSPIEDLHLRRLGRRPPRHHPVLDLSSGKDFFSLQN